MNQSDLILHKEQALKVRQKIIQVGEYCKEKVHWASSLSCVEILIYIMTEISNCANSRIPNECKDVVVVSKGHAALAQYAVMNELGLINEEFIELYQKNGSSYPEELVKDEKLGIECSTGSLGLGLPYCVGMAIYFLRRRKDRRIFCIAGDGECDEGSVWEAIMLAGQHRLNNLFFVVDFNGLQADGNTDNIISWKNMQKQIESFGWNVLIADGHDFTELDLAFSAISEKPTAIIAKTIKGKGISFMENDYSWHDRALSKELLKRAKMEIGL